MKKLPAAILLGSIAAFAAGCEQQSWEETKMFHQNPTAHGSGDHGHAEQSAEAESPASPAPETPAAETPAEQQ